MSSTHDGPSSEQRSEGGGCCDSRNVFATAQRAVEKATANSIVLDQAAEDRIPKFDLQGMCI